MGFTQQDFANADSFNSSADLEEDEAELGHTKEHYEDVTQGTQGQVEPPVREGARNLLQ